MIESVRRVALTWPTGTVTAEWGGNAPTLTEVEATFHDWIAEARSRGCPDTAAVSVLTGQSFPGHALAVQWNATDDVPPPPARAVPVPGGWAIDCDLAEPDIRAPELARIYPDEATARECAASHVRLRHRGLLPDPKPHAQGGLVTGHPDPEPDPIETVAPLKDRPTHRACGRCGIHDIPRVDWPWWDNGRPVHQRCDQATDTAIHQVPLERFAPLPHVSPWRRPDADTRAELIDAIDPHHENTPGAEAVLDNILTTLQIAGWTAPDASAAAPKPGSDQAILDAIQNGPDQLIDRFEHIRNWLRHHGDYTLTINPWGTYWTVTLLEPRGGTRSDSGITLPKRLDKIEAWFAAIDAEGRGA